MKSDPWLKFSQAAHQVGVALVSSVLGLIVGGWIIIWALITWETLCRVLGV